MIGVIHMYIYCICVYVCDLKILNGTLVVDSPFQTLAVIDSFYH